MNILLDQLPTAIRIDGIDYPINSDFRTSLDIILAFEDPELTIQEKYLILVTRLYKETPENKLEALKKGVKFLNGGQDPDPDQEPDTGIRTYSFNKDAALIYAAFRQSHGVDLQAADLHWYQFLALWMDIGQDTAIANLISLRHRIKTGKASKEERKAAQEIGPAFDIEDIDTRSLEERLAYAKFMHLIKGSKK